MLASKSASPTEMALPTRTISIQIRRVFNLPPVHAGENPTRALLLSSACMYSASFVDYEISMRFCSYLGENRAAEFHPLEGKSYTPVGGLRGRSDGSWSDCAHAVTTPLSARSCSMATMSARMRSTGAS